MAGNRARGIPNTIALMSITNVPCSAWRPLRNRSPSRIDAPLALVPPSWGGIGAMARSEAMAKAKVTDIDPVGG